MMNSYIYLQRKMSGLVGRMIFPPGTESSGSVQPVVRISFNFIQMAEVIVPPRSCNDVYSMTGGPMTRGVTYNAEAMHEKFSDLAELRAFAARQITQWERVRERPFEMKAEFTQGGGPIIWSYTNHVVELMRTVLELSEQNRMIIAAPLIRLMVENAITSIWLYLEPRNARAVIHEGFRLRRAAVENILETGLEGFDRSNVDEINQILHDFADSDLPGGRHFEQRCREIVDGLGVYCSWRVISSYSHAGMAMGDFYLEETESAPGLAFRPDAELENHEAWLGTAVCMLIAALKACNEIDGKGSLRSQLDRAAKKMGITLQFTATP